MGVAQWPLEAMLVAGGSAVTHLAWGAHALWNWLRRAEGREDRIHEQGWSEVEKRDHQIDQLRQIIDRSRRRESASTTALELSLIAWASPPEQQADIAKRIKQILSAALPVSGATAS